jgi:hypothetical protein
MFGRLANVSRFAPVWKTSTSSLFEDHLRRKHFIQNFSHMLPGISLDLASFRGSKVQQLFQRLLVLSARRIFKNPQFGKEKKEEIRSFLNLLLNPAFNEGKLLHPAGDSLVDHSSRSFVSKSKTISLLLKNISSKVLYPSISAQVLAGYIRRQMSLPQKLKDQDFRMNLKTGVSMLALFLLKRFPLGSSIRGLRIVCSGR